MSKVKRQKSLHPNQTKTPEVITYRLIKEFKREKMNGEDKYGNFIVWWVVQWCRSEEIVLEKRRIYITQKGDIRTGKLIGWHKGDMEWLSENSDEIYKLLQE